MFLKIMLKLQNKSKFVYYLTINPHIGISLSVKHPYPINQKLISTFDFKSMDKYIIK